MLGTILSLYLTISIVLCFVRIRYGVAMFLIYTVCVPYLTFFSFGKNVFPFLIVTALIYNYGPKGLYFKSINPFIFLYCGLLLLIPFHDTVSLTYQLDLIRAEIMGTLFLPFAMINVIKRDRKALKLFTSSLFLCVIIAVFYTLFLATKAGQNPYLSVMMPLSGGEFNEAYASTDNAGRVFGRISGLFAHPMSNGLFLSFSIVFIYNLLIKVETKLYKSIYTIVLFLALFAIFLIGVRTAIVASSIGIIAFVVLEGKFKLAVYLFFGGVIVLFLLAQIPGMEVFVSSIFNQSSGNVGGSSLEMRLSQLEGALYEIRLNPLFGHGYGWTAFYKNTRGDHPVLLAFESLVYFVLCNNGFIGLGIWIAAIVLYIKNIRKRIKASVDKNLLYWLMVVYLSYSMITGEYGYMKYFLVFYTLLWTFGLKRNSNQNHVN